jgi:hypothetical protein
VSKDLVSRPGWGTPSTQRAGVPTGGQSASSSRLAQQTWDHGRHVVGADDLRGLGLPASLIATWESDPAGATHRLKTAANAISVIDELDSYDRMDLVARFEYGTLGENIQSAILEQLGIGLPGFVKPASDKMVERFCETEEGRILQRHWRSRTAKNLAIALTRIGYIKDQLSGHECEQIDDWIESLSVQQRIAIWIALTTE